MHNEHRELLEALCPNCETCWEIEPEWMSFRCAFCGKTVEICSETGITVDLLDR